MGKRVRAFDWAAKALGSPEQWPVSLRTLVNLLLASTQPMFIAWGPERTWLYNDAFIPICYSACKIDPLRRGIGVQK
jgi:hypothetical protein